MKRFVLPLILITFFQICLRDFLPSLLSQEGNPSLPEYSKSEKDETPKLPREEALRDSFETLARSHTTKVQYKNERGILFGNNKAEISLDSIDAIKGANKIFYSLNDSEYKPYTVPVPVKREGRNILKYRSVDITGNEEDANRLEILIDNTPPILQYSLDGKSYIKDRMVYYSPGTRLSLSAYDGDSGVKDIFVNINGEGYIPKNYQDLTFTKPGYFTIHVISLDNVLNRSQEYILKFTIDTEPPSPQIKVSNIIYRYGKSICSGRSRVSLFASDKDSGLGLIQYRILPTNEWTNYAGEFSLQPDQMNLEMEFKATDNVGNESQILRYQCPIDREPPKTKLEIRRD